MSFRRQVRKDQDEIGKSNVEKSGRNLERGKELYELIVVVASVPDEMDAWRWWWGRRCTSWVLSEGQARHGAPEQRQRRQVL